MSGKVIGWIVVALVVVIGAWYLWSMNSGAGAPPATVPSTQTTDQTQGTSASNSVPDTSDAALDQDAASIDTQLQAASTDSNTAASFSDTQVAQTE